MFNSQGRLGNQMMDYATIYVVARELGYVGFLDNAHDNLNRIFKHIELPDLGEPCRTRLEKSHWDTTTGRKFLELSYNRSTNASDMAKVTASCDTVVFGHYEWVPVLFLKYLDELKFQFQFRDLFMNEALTTIDLVSRLYLGNTKPPLFVGVHVRRGDYQNHFNDLYHIKLLGPEFYVKAMEYFNDKYSDKHLVIFLAVTDDNDWVNKHLKFEHFYVVSKTANADMALLSICNHTITDYGTFGFWPSLFHGGEHYTTNVYEDFIVAPMYQIKGWTVVSVTTPLSTGHNINLEMWQDRTNLVTPQPENPVFIELGNTGSSKASNSLAGSSSTTITR
ncbi:hypothetical protein M8J77_003781 [Diaphorina citri]|nr:hypothetical protein M8J77_003781 [Diaphorina citri]